MGSITEEGRRPRLSVGMPVYNAAPYLESAVDSLLSQTFRDFELIISDNASTDATPEICRGYAARDTRVRYVRQAENRGGNWNFNEVFRLSRGAYFKWAAADDEHAPTFLERCIEVLDADAGYVACHSVTMRIDERGKPLGPAHHAGAGSISSADNPAGSPTLAASGSAHRRFRDVLLNSGWGVRCSGVFRAEALRNTGLLEPYYGWEKIVFAELALQGRCHLVEERLFRQRVHGSAWSQQRRKLPRLQYVRGYLRAAWRRAPSAYDRAWCLVWIASYLLQVRKILARLTPDRAPKPMAPSMVGTAVVVGATGGGAA